MGYVVCAREVWKEIPRERGSLVVLRDCSLEAGPGVTSLVGCSGAGKTSLLHVLSGLDAPTRGTVVVDGVNVYALSETRRTQFIRDHIGFVFQDANLVPYLTLEENAVLPLNLAGRRVDAAQLDSLFTCFSLAHSRHTRAEAASGGEAQRCAIIRALISRPQVLFADEPTGALDSNNSQVVLKALRSIGDSGATVIIVTHDPVIASLSDRVVFMRDGRVTRVATDMSASEVLEGMNEQREEASDAAIHSEDPDQ